MYCPASLTKQKWFHRMNFVLGHAGLLVQAKVKRAKAPKRHAVRRICPCHSMADNKNYICFR